MAEIKRATVAPSGAALVEAQSAFKAAGNGEVTAVFSRLGVIDADGDVTVAGAFDDGAPVVISAYGHGSWGPGVLPVGKGRIRMSGDTAILDGQFFMTTQPGRETFETVRELGPLGRWSYGYDATEFDYGDFQGKRVRFLRRIQVHEVSPVLLAAGVGTATLDAKARAELEAIRDAVLGDDGEAAAREYLRFVRHLSGVGHE